MYELPHIRVPGEPTSERYQRRGGGDGGEAARQIADRKRHAAALRASLEGAVQGAQVTRGEWPEDLRAEGINLAVVGWPGGFQLALQSLDLQRSGIELLSVRSSTGDPPSPEIATVFVPDQKVGQFFSRLDQYASQETRTGTPRHQKLVANIAALQQATLEQMWTDHRPYPRDGIGWWEIWLRRTGREMDTLARVARVSDWRLAARAVKFPMRTVTAVRADLASVSSSLSSRLPIAEIRYASLAESAAELPYETQRQWVKEALDRIVPAPQNAPAVCLLDTGVHGHSLLRESLNKGDVRYVVGFDGRDRNGHGTEMAGLALLGDVDDALTSPLTVELLHRLESVKVIPDGETASNPPETYGAVTAAGVSEPEISAPGRRRSYCMPSSDHGYRSGGRPTLWSATIDALSFGTDVVASESGLDLLSDPDPASGRLLIVATGNVRDGHETDFLNVCDTSVIEDPGQSWNALTVGAFTELTHTPAHPDFVGYRALADTGELSPFSRTSVAFARNWPLKPDIVMEGGNLLVSPSATRFDPHEVVSLTTTSRLEPYGHPLTTTNATSAATAQAARLAGRVMANYPDYWPETVRGLLVHAAEWTLPMADAIEQASGKRTRRQLIRRYGFGVPSDDRVLHSASNAVTLIAQSYIWPFERVGSGRTRLREMHLHDLPWPREQLLDLGEMPVRLRVTLSYFVEPNASSRGWRGRYVYPSHGLRFDIRRPGETTGEFRRRLNRLAEVEEGRTQRSPGQEPNWLVGQEGRNLGSLHADLWEGTAADLADCGVLGVYPIGGWWKNNNRADRTDLSVRYALLVSLYTPEVEVDLYTPIAAQIGIPVAIAT